MSPFLNPPFIISILIALSVHEWAHAYSAFKLGDPTAKYDGRMTLNPLSHLDPLGTIMFVVVGFGWGKPVPVDWTYFKNPKRDNAIVALAGPLSNLVLAIISFVILVTLTEGSVGSWAMGLLSVEAVGGPLLSFVTEIAASSLFINLALMAFNLLPIAPLDGSKIVHPFVPLRHEEMYLDLMRKGPMILLGVLIAERLIGFPLLTFWVRGIITGVMVVMNAAVGIFM